MQAPDPIFHNISFREIRRKSFSEADDLRGGGNGDDAQAARP
jgi:hypothetical protein